MTGCTKDGRLFRHSRKDYRTFGLTGAERVGAAAPIGFSATRPWEYHRGVDFGNEHPVLRPVRRGRFWLSALSTDLVSHDNSGCDIALAVLARGEADDEVAEPWDPALLPSKSLLDEERIIGAPPELDSDCLLVDRELGGGVDELAEQRPGSPMLIAVANPVGQ